MNASFEWKAQRMLRAVGYGVGRAPEGRSDGMK